MRFDHVLIVGFGGPEKREDVWPFLETVTQGRRVPEERLREVERHYDAVGGSSPYNSRVLHLAGEIDEALAAAGHRLPVFTGMRNWYPFLNNTLAAVKDRGLKRGLALILAPHRSEASYDRYVQDIDAARAEAGASEILYEYPEPWHDHPLFILAQAEGVRAAWEELTLAELEAARTIFTAHSIPLSMPGRENYERQLHTSCRLVAEELGLTEWDLAYQSRSGNPRDPWLSPDPVETVRGLAGKKEAALFVPVGFPIDNVEILYDLDVEARAAAEAAGLRYLRAPTACASPLFADMFRDLVIDRL